MVLEFILLSVCAVRGTGDTVGNRVEVSAFPEVMVRKHSLYR